MTGLAVARPAHVAAHTDVDLRVALGLHHVRVRITEFGLGLGVGVDVGHVLAVVDVGAAVLIVVRL